MNRSVIAIPSCILLIGFLFYCSRTGSTTYQANDCKKPFELRVAPPCPPFRTGDAYCNLTGHINGTAQVSIYYNGDALQETKQLAGAVSYVWSDREAWVNNVRVVYTPIKVTGGELRITIACGSSPRSQ